MQKQNGFTLIELVVVIIILGILAVTAAPKFINLQSDARASALQGVKGAIQGANSLVFAKAALAGGEKNATADWTTAIPGVEIGAAAVAVTNFGYLQATIAELNNAVEADFGASATDWIVVIGADDDGVATATITQTGSPVEVTTSGSEAACKLVYTEATATTVPTYVITDNGC
ncbi:type II secretion system protein [Shewanella youngdeokensis]|uniref:Type II secretion system protein n=1 Tax=Shewanella youngdeokensis TaxID=2999068 RepID=A0ABZ0JWV6_9GAMM|nr:type II secretion system protein [Shewanella sp. DAU334]